MTTNKDDKCNVCRHSGLAFLFLRQGAIGKEPTSSIVPMGPQAPATDTKLVSAMQLPELKYSRYILRKLRPGYLHIYHEKIPKWLAAIRVKANSKEPDAAHWEVYRVTPSGALIPDYEPSFLTGEDFVCNTDRTHILTAIAYRLRDAHQSGRIRVAFSANLWPAKLRAQNKGNPEVMEIIDIPAILSGTLPSNAAYPKAEWINKHVAEFALQDIRHGNLVPTHPLRAHYQEGSGIEKRFAELDADHQKTSGKSLAVVLSDPTGTAIDLADISKGRYKIGLDHAEKQRHPAGAAIRLTMLQQQAKQAATVKLSVDPAKKNLLSSFLRRNAQGQVVSEADKIAISDEMLMVKLGMADNIAGVTAGLSEMSAIGAQALKLTGTATLMNVVLSFAGAAGAFANAWQNWEKAEGKTREGDVVFVWAYRFVFGFFFLAGSALAVNGGALVVEWLSKRAALRAGVRFTAGRLLTFALTRLTVWGWVLTLVAFIIEGVVNWFDRTKLEAWVENCHFGDEPKFKGWQDEEAAFDAAMEDMRQQALRQGDADLPDDATK